MNFKRRGKYLVILISVVAFHSLMSKAYKIPENYQEKTKKISQVSGDPAKKDTIPLKDRKGDFINDKNTNPFDITPSTIKQSVEYDPVTGQYIILEKIGDEYYRTPTYMTFEEYLEWKSKEQERKYFNSLAGIKSDKKSATGKVDPMDKVDIKNSLVDRLFGGSEVNIKPTGSVDLSIGWLYSRRNDPSLPILAQRQSIPEIRPPAIRMNVDGAIGKKLKLDFNYDTQANFNFDRIMKIAFDSDAFSEDDIIKKIEAGNVNLPLRGNLIKGAQSLFGVKTELQFARLRITALASQQRARTNNLKIQNGTNVTEFEIYPDDYDENRHFFISHFNRENYEQALSRLPYINTPFQIAQLEVWISDDRPEFQLNSTMVAAVADLGEPEKENFSSNPINTQTNCIAKDARGNCLPTNASNDLYTRILNNEDIVDIDKASRILQAQFGLQQSKDFEIFRGRKLNPSEYTYHPKLGFISLNNRLRPNQILGIAYNYYYTDNCDTLYQVGQLSASSLQFGDQTPPVGVPPDSAMVEPPKLHFIKLIKPINQNTTSPMWDLMMKNVYPLRTSQLNQQDFEFDIYYENDFNDGSLLKFIPEERFRKLPLLQVFNMDRLNRYGDPQADGIFDFVSGVTVIEKTGSIVFPILEPFGTSMKESINNLLIETAQPPLETDEYRRLDSLYTFQQLYDTTLSIARLSLERNKFVMRGKVKGASNGEISLGPFVPRGSVRVTAGGKQLIEGVDYEIDYSLGRLRIINETYNAQGTPINVSFEDNAVFSLQQKTMIGLRAEYNFNKNSILGGTFLRFKERPFTQKINIGEDPINNKVFGLDYSLTSEVPWLTKALDKLPFYSTKEKSLINFTAETAVLLPGHNSFIDGAFDYNGIAHIDDFEGAITGVNLGSFNPNQWSLASTPTTRNPSGFPEAKLDNSLIYGANRAKLAWYVLDRGVNRSSGSQDATNAYTRQILQTELFPLRENPIGQNDLFTFDLSFYPDERGPYNYDRREGYPGYTAGVDIVNNKLKLRDPESRWGGIMRYFQNPDFEAANYEFIEFWMLNPFMDRPDGREHSPNENGEIVINLGNVSEDIIKDEILFFENALPTSQQPFPIQPNVFGRATTSIPLVNGFDVQEGKGQDVGFDGISNENERNKFEDWITSMNNLPAVLADPAADDFKFFNDEIFEDPNSEFFTDNLLDRIKYFNGPEGNAPLNNSQSTSNQFVRGNRYPDTEDLNNNKSIDKAESFYEYRIRIRNNGGELDIQNLPYYKQSIEVRGTGGQTEKWYRFQIPIQEYMDNINGMQGYRSIQFMRMYLTNFETPKVFRLAEFQLLRSQWRRVPNICDSELDPKSIQFTLDEVGLQENSERVPFKYISPKGIQQQIINNATVALRQDEKAMSLVFSGLEKGCEVGATKLARLDITQYKRLQMFVHAEDRQKPIEEGKLALVLRLGKDYRENYYEYILPLKMSNKDYGGITDSIWLKRNFINLNLDSLVEVKKLRNQAGFPAVKEFGIAVDPAKGDSLIIKGNPSLGLVKVFQVGLRSLAKDFGDSLSGEVWINELRLTDFREEAAIAAQSKLQIQLADLGELNFSGNYSSVGYGALDQRLQERQREESLQYDAAVNLEAGKLLPKEADIKAPIFAQYSKTSIIPQYDAFDRDIEVKDKIAEARTQAEKQEIRDRNRDETVIKTFAVTNLKTQFGDNKLPWAPSNFAFTYAFTENTRRTPILAEDKSVQQTVGLDYVYNRKSSYIEPFKFIKAKSLKIISDFNFSLFPSNFSFNSKMVRLTNNRTFRLPDIPVYRFDDIRFTWDRNYSMDWDLSRALRLNFRASSTSLVDELRQGGIEDNPVDRPWYNEYGKVINPNNIDVPIEEYARQYRNNNILKLGRSKFYKHNAGLNYRLPFNNIPILNWITATADYKLEYGWEGGSLIEIDEKPTLLGNIIKNGQNRSVNTTFSFDKLYGKWGYLKGIETGKAPRKTSRSNNASGKSASKSTGGKGKNDAGMDVAGANQAGDEGGNKNLSNAQGDKSKGKSEKGSKKEDKPRDPTLAERIIIRPLLLLRSVKVNYREELATQIPGFMPNAELLGLSEGFSAPGLDFAAGVQPRLTGKDNWLQQNKDWFNNSNNFNTALSQNKRHNIDVKVLLEPFKDFSIDVTFNKNYSENHTEVFRTKTSFNGEFLQLAKYDVGSFDASYISMATLWMDSKDLYNKFKDNRKVISSRLPNIPGAGIDSTGHTIGYGPLSNAVNIPAFVAAYTNTNAFLVDLDIQNQFSSLSYIPKPNWQINYNGLSKLKPFKDIFSNITIKHGYRSTIRANRFETQPNWSEADPFLELSPNNNYYSRLEIPGMAISEQFAPVIGVSIKSKSDFKLDFEYKISRNLELGPTQLREARNTEIVLGSGYVWKNFKGFGKTSKKKTNKKKKAESLEEADNDPTKIKRTTNIKGRDLKFNLAFSYRDDQSEVFNLTDGLSNARADRGSRTVSFNPTLEYDVNKNLALRYYFEYSNNIPKTTLNFPSTTIRTGVTLRFSLN